MVVGIEYNSCHFILAILVVWRLTRLLCFENGPFHMLLKIRELFYKLHLGNLIECFHCSALWVSIIIAPVMFGLAVKTIFIAVGTSGGASIIQLILESFSTQASYHEFE